MFLQDASFLLVDHILLVPTREQLEWFQTWYQWRTCDVIVLFSSLVREVFA